MKVFISFALLATTLFADSIVKKDADIDAILNRIDAIAQTIKQRELEEQQLMQQNQTAVDPQMMQNPQMSEEQKLQDEIMKEEQELEAKEKKLQLSQKKQDYYQRYEQIRKKSRAYLEKKTAKTIKELQSELYALKKKKSYTINIKRYMKIGSSVYAYVKKERFDSAKTHIENIDTKIENIKKSIEKLKKAKSGDRDMWMQVLASMDNQILENPLNIEKTANSMPVSSPNTNAKGYVKLQEGEEIDGIYVKSVNEKRVVLASKDE